MSKKTHLVLILFVLLITGPLYGQDLAISKEIGKLDGDLSEVFGFVKDAAFTEEGRILVLDSRMLELRLFDSLGAWIDSTGRSGKGPGEFTIPVAMIAVPRGAAVLDRGNSRITYFAVSDSLTLEIDHEIPLQFHAWDMCITSDRIFLASNTFDEPVVEVDQSGQILRKFGAVPPPPDLPLDTPASLRASAERMSFQGRLDCSEKGVVWASNNYGTIFFYSLDGEEIFSTSLPGFAPMSPEFTERRTVRYGPRKGISYMDGVRTVLILGNKALFQGTRTDYAAREHTRLGWMVDLESGQAELFSGIEPLLRAKQGNRVLLSREDPFPQLLLGVWEIDTQG